MKTSDTLFSSLTVPEIFVHSSNIGTAKMALVVGTPIQRAYLAKMGLLTPIASEIKETGTPIVPARWGDLETMTVAYGHGIAVTPLHIAAASAANAAGGCGPGYHRGPYGGCRPNARVVVVRPAPVVVVAPRARVCP